MKDIIKAINLCAEMGKRQEWSGKTVKNASLFVKKTKPSC